MIPIDKTKLLSSYRPPEVRRGDWLFCEIRGKVEVGGYTYAPIPWPHIKRGGRPVLILCGDLVKAVKTESEAAIMHWWGVSDSTVRKWRRVLGVPRMTPGTTLLHREWSPERFGPDALDKAREALKSPEVRAKIAEAKIGRPLHPNSRKALMEAVSKPKSEAWKKQHSERMREQWADGTRRHHLAWTKEEIALLGTTTDREVGEQIGRQAAAVRMKRIKLSIEPYDKKKARNARADTRPTN